jgi:hypothetical protein
MRKYSVEQAIDIGASITGAATILVGALIALVLGVILIKLLWTWSVPDLFPGATAQGLISHDLTWLAALKLATIVAILNSTGMLIAGKWRR